MATTITFLNLLGWAVFLYFGCYNIEACHVGPNSLLLLTEHLMDHYGRGFSRPVFHQSDLSSVSIKMTFDELQELSTRKESITVSTLAQMSWTDEYLKWNVTQYDGVSSITLPVSAIWHPDITLLESVDEDFVSFKPNTMVTVESNGRVTWQAPAIFSNSCKQRVRYFPFDTQLCEFRFASFSFNKSEIELFSDQRDDDFAVIRLLENIYWESRQLSIFKESVPRIGFEDQQFSTLTYRILFSRRYTFHLLYLIVPGVLLSLVSPMVFYLPPISKQKLTFAVTNMLAFVVFQQLVTGSIPYRSDYKPILGTYLECMITLACIAVAATAIEIHVAFGDGPVSPWVEKLFLHTFAKFAGQKWLHSKYRHRLKSNTDLKTIQSTSEEAVGLVKFETEHASPKVINKPVHIRNIPGAIHDDQKPVLNQTDNNNEGDKYRFQMILREVAALFDQSIPRQATTGIEDEDHKIRLNICHVIDRFLFCIFLGIVLVVTTVAILYLIIGSIWDFGNLKELF
ncbi:neuronal acetylcholine receptor subunit alpha-10-like isoform X2 [Amphiura filiformis]|uniref:neuronal acetylcholine receptor subunit alpha-10-like isoform X2 n=1 Tax=Amphiura filiformis TaxID=82378 RepID=UPI003B223F06